MLPGDVFMIEDDDEEKEHLHVVLTTPTERDEVVTVAICTRHQRSETLVCLEVGDHPFIRQSSVASYRHARIRSCAQIREAVQAGRARAKPRVSEQVLVKLQAALPESDFVANDVRAFFQEVSRTA